MMEALGLAKAAGFDAVEIAPIQAFGRWDDVAEKACRLRDSLLQHGLVCSALQGILHDTDDVALFGSDAARDRLQRHLEAVARLAGLLGAGACVFGAPKLRDPGARSAGAAWDIAVATLRRAGPAFAAAGSTLAFEANARQYGCRFVTTTAEAVRLVSAVDTPGIGLQIDTGTILLEGEPPAVLLGAAPIAVHAHVSERDLRPPGTDDHAALAAALRDSGYAGSLSIEMTCVPAWRSALRTASAFVRRAYA